MLEQRVLAVIFDALSSHPRGGLRPPLSEPSKRSALKQLIWTAQRLSRL